MTWKRFRNGAAAIACWGMLLSPVAWGEQVGVSLPVPAAMPIADVALGDGGLLVGRVIDVQGNHCVGATVSVRQGEHEIVRTTADANGVFAAQGLRGGIYSVETDHGIAACRLWAPQTAPPGALSNAVVVRGDGITRGQFGYVPGGAGHAWLGWIKAHPYLTAGTIAAAIAIPIAFADDDSGPSS